MATNETTAERSAAIIEAWRTLDPQSTGFVSPQKLVASFKAESHPWVLAGLTTGDHIKNHFLEKCEIGSEVSGCASFREFALYMESAYSSELVDDARFEVIVKALWGVTCNVELGNHALKNAISSITASQKVKVEEPTVIQPNQHPAGKAVDCADARVYDSSDGRPLVSKRRVAVPEGNERLKDGPK